MRKTLFFLLAACIGLYKGWEWFNSPAFLDFVMKQEEKPWSSQVLLKTARYHIFADDWAEASKYIEACLNEKFEKRPERPECFYERARILDATGQIKLAAPAYEEFFKLYPEHPKVPLAQRRWQYLKYGS